MILAPGASFIDSSKRRLKAVLLHNSNVLAFIPLEHSTNLSESYETLKLVLEKIKYHDHEWKIAVILRTLDCCWDNKETTQNLHVSYASGIAVPGTNTACVIFYLRNET
jgi:hypothetical protein